MKFNVQKGIPANIELRYESGRPFAIMQVQRTTPMPTVLLMNGNRFFILEDSPIIQPVGVVIDFRYREVTGMMLPYWQDADNEPPEGETLDDQLGEDLPAKMR